MTSYRIRLGVISVTIFALTAIWFHATSPSTAQMLNIINQHQGVK